MILGLTGHGKNIGENHFYVKIPPQVVGAAHNQDKFRAMLNDVLVETAQQSPGGITANTAVDDLYGKLALDQ